VQRHNLWVVLTESEGALLEDAAATERFEAVQLEPDGPLDDDDARTEEERDRLATMVSIGLIVLGFVLMGLGWYGASGKNFIQQQFPYLLSGGLPGLALAIIGGGVVVVRDVRRERQAVEARMARLEELVELAVRGSQVVEPVRRARKPAELVVLGPTTFHLPACRLLRDKEGLESGSREEAAARGLTPCRVCAP
jgi:hypothetical protein